MSGINHLYDLYNKKGKEFVDQLFNTYVTVNEKMDGSAFTFERDKETGKFKFYRRDQRNPITLVDRTLMKYYEKPIQYIESLPPHILEQIPRGWRFGLEYFANTKPVEITYDRIPKNHLLLSYVHEYGDDGKIKKTIQDKGELDNWADLLGVDRAPIIFQGYLTDDQKDKITDFLRTPFEGLVQKFKTQSFVRYIISTLNPKLTKTALNDDLDKDVEGIVFRFGEPSKENEPVLAKMVDPVFTQMAKDKSIKQREDKPSDFLGIALMDVMNFILEKGLDDFRVEGDTEDERYISFMSDVFAKFLDKYSDKYRGADFEEPEYLKREEFRLNKDLVDDRRVLKYVNDDDSFESLFKLMLNSFRKIKSRASGIITKGMMEQMNLLIRDIKDYIEKPRKGKLNESSFPSFLDFRKEMAPSVQYLKEEDEETEADENPFYSYREFITALETIDNTPKGIVTEADRGKLKDVNLIVGRFQPFHNGHLKMARFLKEKNGNPAVAVVVYPGHNKSGKSPFNEDLIKKYMDGIVRDEKEIVDYIIVQRGLIGSAIVKLLEKGYKPNLIGAGEDRMDDYTKQLDYVKKSDIGDQMHNLKLVQTPRATSATEVRNAIKDEDYQKFKKLVPAGVEKMYAALKSAVDGKMQESFDLDEESSLIMEGEIFEGVTPDISLDGIRKDIEDLQEYLKSLAERGSITDDEKKKLSSVSDAVNRIKNLTKGHSADEEKLKALVADLVFGGSGDKKSKGRKIHKIDNLFHDLSGPTVDNLIARYISNGDIKPISLDDIKNNLGGILDINLSSGLNGISGKDIKKIYNFDSSVGSGLQQRGRGETLFSLAFNSIKNDLAGGDVRSLDDDKVIEIKSSNNAGITPKSGPPLAMKVEDIVQNAGRLFDLPELKNNRMQKTSSESLMSSIKEGGEKADQFLTLVSDLSGIESPTAEDILPIILLLQLDYYSKEMEEFQTFAIFIEREDAPDKIVILDSKGKTFVTPENIETLKNSKVAPKITSSDRVEIYMFNKKIKK